MAVVQATSRHGLNLPCQTQQPRRCSSASSMPSPSVRSRGGPWRTAAGCCDASHDQDYPSTSQQGWRPGHNRLSHVRAHSSSHSHHEAPRHDDHTSKPDADPCSSEHDHRHVDHAEPHKGHQHEDDDHHHHHHHEEGGHHHHHHHHHENFMTNLLRQSRILGLANSMEHSWACIIASAACFALSLLLSAPPVHAALAASSAGSMLQALQLKELLLAATFVLTGIPQVVDTLVHLGSFIIDTHVLMSLAVIGTVFLGMAHEGALLLLLFQLSHILEEKFTARAQGSLARLLDTVPTRATTVQMPRGSGGGAGGSSGGPLLATATSVRADSVTLGQHVLVRPGEQVPLDGDIVWGSASVSLQHISGESAPVRLTVGNAVPAGSLNADGLLVVCTTASVDDSTPYRMARMAAKAQSAKPRLQSLLDSIGGIWSKAVIVATLVTLVALPLLFKVPLWGPHGALYRAMGVLTAGSPCAVVLVPLAYVCSIAAITRRGVLVKGAATLDDLCSITHVALDKTGTITSGTLTLKRAYVVDAPAVGSSAAASPSLQQLPLPVRQRPSQAPGTSRQHDVASSASALSSGTAANGDRSSSLTTGDPSTSASFSTAALQYAVALSRASSHPVSRAVAEVGRWMQQAGEAAEVHVSSFEQVPGSGVHAVCQLPGRPAHFVRFGSLDFVSERLVGGTARLNAAVAAERSQQHTRSGATSFLSASLSEDDANSPSASGRAVSGGGGKALPAALSALSAAATAVRESEEADVAMFCFEDVVRPGVASAVAELRQGTWKTGCSAGGASAGRAAKDVVMLTGDNEEVAAYVAASVGIQTIRTGMKPEQKLQYVTAFDSTPEQGLLMMGDGINDAPSLAAARVGVAVASTPSDLVAAAADLIVLNGQGVANLPWLLRSAHKTRSIVKQNLALALIAMVCATLPTVAGVFPLWLAVTLHEGSTLLVALNSLRLLLGPNETLMGALASSLRRRFSSGLQGVRSVLRVPSAEKFSVSASSMITDAS